MAHVNYFPHCMSMWCSAKLPLLLRAGLEEHLLQCEAEGSHTIQVIDEFTWADCHSCVCVYWQNTKNEGKWHLNGLTASWELLFPFSSVTLAFSKEQGGIMQNCYKHVTFWQAPSSIHPVYYLYLLQEFFKVRGILVFMFLSLLFPEKN